MDDNNKLEIFLKTKFPFFDKQDHRVNVKRLKKVFDVDTDDEIADCLECPDEVIVLLMDKYAVKTCIEVMNTIQHYLLYYKSDRMYLWEFENILDNLLDLQRNPKQYLKLSFIEIQKKLEYFQIKFLQGNPSYTHYRNFMIFNLFFYEAPMALHHYSNIVLVQKDFVNLEDLIYRKIFLVKKQGNIYFVFNRWISQKFEGQYIYEITNEVLKKIIIKFLSHYSQNIHHFLTTKSGKPMSNGNFANTIVNFSRSFFGKSTTLNNVRKLWATYKAGVYDPEIQKKKIMYEFK